MQKPLIMLGMGQYNKYKQCKALKKIDDELIPLEEYPTRMVLVRG